MRIRRLMLLAAAALTFVPASARADATAFVGVHANPERQQVRGFAGGFGLLIVGFEFEYATASEDEANAIPSLKTYSGNVLLQTPFPVFGVQFYGTTGVGGYREEVDATNHSETNLVFNTGGGAKITLIGPLRVRVDYRVLKLRGEPLLPSTIHRLYAGVNLSF